MVGTLYTYPPCTKQYKVVVRLVTDTILVPLKVLVSVESVCLSCHPVSILVLFKDRPKAIPLVVLIEKPTNSKEHSHTPIAGKV